MDNLFFGTYKLIDEDILLNTLDIAYKVGYRKFDCAELYKNQHIISKFFSNIPRSDYYITSKLSFRIIPKGEAMIRESLDKTLSYFDNFIDLMLIHAPVKNDILAWKILTEYKEKKLIKNIGISNYNLKKLEEFRNAIDNPDDIYCNQIEFNPFLNRKDLIERCHSYNIKLISYGCMYHNDITIEKIANKLNKTKEQVLIKYALQKQFSVIVTSTIEQYIKDDSDMNFTIDEIDMTYMDNIDNININSMYKRFL